MKIQGKLMLGFGLELALVAAVAAAGVFGLQSVKGSFQSAIEHGLKVQRLATSMKSELLEARRAESEFLLRWPSEGFAVANRKYVSANRARVAQIHRLASELEATGQAPGVTVPDNRAMEDLVALRPYVNVYAEDFDAAVSLIGELGSTERAPQETAIPPALRSQIDKKITDFRSAAVVIEPLVDDIATFGQQNAAAEVTLADLASRRTVFAVSACFLAAIVTGFGLAYLLGAQIRRPLERLVRTAEAVGAGDLTAQAEVLSLDETGTLARAFNSMTGRLRGLVAALEERVAERERAEQALRGSQDLLQAIIDTSTAVIYVKDLEGRYLLINRRFEDLFHVPKGSVFGKTDHDLFPKGAADAFRAVDQRVLAAGTTLEAEEVAPHDDGLHTYISIKCPLVAEDGKPYAVCGISTDITERKHVEEQLRQSQKMDAIGRLAGGIAHDFNNILMVINGWSGVALAQTDPSSPLHELLSEISSAGQRAARLTHQLLAYSRKQVLEPKLWNLNLIVAEMEPMLRSTIGEDVDFLAVLPADVGLVQVDRGQIEQILMNLVINAREAMPDGGSLTVETGNVVLSEKATELGLSLGPHTLLAVSDTGTGMISDVKARIFDPFFTTKGVGKGTGLGLSVVYGIVKQSGGSISVYSEPGKGTTFRIYFPVAERQADRPAESVSRAPPDLRGSETILLVEDEESVRKFARQVLETQGYSVLSAANGRDAQKVLETNGKRVAMVITDVVMPEMGGRSLSMWVREKMPTLPILFISGYTENAAAHEGVVNVGEHFLQKPFSPAELCAKVRQRLDMVDAARGRVYP